MGNKLLVVELNVEISCFFTSLRHELVVRFPDQAFWRMTAGDWSRVQMWIRSGLLRIYDV